MIDRRILLASLAGLFGLAAFRWLRTTPAQAAEKFEVEKTDAEWRAQLTPQQYEILRKHGTERPGSSPLLKEKRKGIFACAGCDLPLFSSETKYESGTGWPSFWKPLDNAIGETKDTAFGMTRIESCAKRCGMPTSMHAQGISRSTSLSAKRTSARADGSKCSVKHPPIGWILPKLTKTPSPPRFKSF